MECGEQKVLAKGLSPIWKGADTRKARIIEEIDRRSISVGEKIDTGNGVKNGSKTPNPRDCKGNIVKT